MISSAPGIWQDGTSRRISLRVPAAPVTDLTTTVVMSFFFSFSMLVPEEVEPDEPPEPPMTALPYFLPQRLHSALEDIKRSKWYTPFSI